MDERTGRSVNRVLGGSPISVLVRLLIMSFVVGLILHVLNINPADIVAWLNAQIRALTNLSFGAVADIINILVVGAVIVVPVWLILRVLRLFGR